MSINEKMFGHKGWQGVLIELAQWLFNKKELKAKVI